MWSRCTFPAACVPLLDLPVPEFVIRHNWFFERTLSSPASLAELIDRFFRGLSQRNLGEFRPPLQRGRRNGRGVDPVPGDHVRFHIPLDHGLDSPFPSRTI